MSNSKWVECFVLISVMLGLICSSCTYIVLPNAHMSPVGYDKEVKTKLKIPLIK